MTIGKAAGLAGLAIVILPGLFEVTIPLDVAPARDVQIPDPAVEAEYSSCYQEKDRAMHRAAFGTIDNPDVQKEFISSNRVHIARDCRLEFPEQLITVQEPPRFNLVDLEPRFW
jgi:hypothetical protein